MFEYNYIPKRILQLRLQNNVSARRLSLDLGFAPAYITSVESGRCTIPLTSLLYICEYFKIEPKDFFDTENNDPAQITAFVTRLKRRSPRQIDRMLRIGNEVLDEMENKY